MVAIAGASDAATPCRYFEERKSEAEEGCIIEEGEREWGSAQCSSLERLEDFVRQFVGQAPTHMFVKTLLVLEAADQRAAKQASSAGQPADLVVLGGVFECHSFLPSHMCIFTDTPLKWRQHLRYRESAVTYTGFGAGPMWSVLLPCQVVRH